MCSLETENNSHHLLHCHHKTPFRIDLTNSLNTFAIDFESLSDNKKVEIVLCGDSLCIHNKNNFVLAAFTNYIKKTKRFDCSLFDQNYFFSPLLHLIFVF